MKPMTPIAATVLALALPALGAAGYVWLSCERFATKAGQCNAQWAQAGSLVLTGGAWVMGYWQPNRCIRERERELLMTAPPAAGAGPEPGGPPAG